MRHKLPIGFLALLMALSLPSLAQTQRASNLGLVADAEYSAPLFGDVTVAVEEELRFKSYGGFHLDRWLNSVSLETPVNIPMLGKRLHLGAQVGYMRHYDDEQYYDNRFRWGVDLSYYENYRRFKFTYRSRLLCTYRDERTGDYRVNPKWYWRHKLQAAYQMPGSRFKYTLASELFWRLRQDPRDSFVDQLRSTLTVSYRLTRRQYFSAFVRMDNDLQVATPMDTFYFGVGYEFKN